MTFTTASGYLPSGSTTDILCYTQNPHTSMIKQMEVCILSGTTYTITLINTIPTGQRTRLSITTQGQAEDGLVVPSTFAPEEQVFTTEPNTHSISFDMAPPPRYFKSISVSPWSKEKGLENIMDIYFSVS